MTGNKTAWFLTAGGTASLTYGWNNVVVGLNNLSPTQVTVGAVGVLAGMAGLCVGSSHLLANVKLACWDTSKGCPFKPSDSNQ